MASGSSTHGSPSITVSWSINESNGKTTISASKTNESRFDYQFAIRIVVDGKEKKKDTKAEKTNDYSKWSLSCSYDCDLGSTVKVQVKCGDSECGTGWSSWTTLKELTLYKAPSGFSISYVSNSCSSLTFKAEWTDGVYDATGDIVLYGPDGSTEISRQQTLGINEEITFTGLSHMTGYKAVLTNINDGVKTYNNKASVWAGTAQLPEISVHERTTEGCTFTIDTHFNVHSPTNNDTYNYIKVGWSETGYSSYTDSIPWEGPYSSSATGPSFIGQNKLIYGYVVKCNSSGVVDSSSFQYTYTVTGNLTLSLSCTSTSFNSVTIKATAGYNNCNKLYNSAPIFKYSIDSATYSSTASSTGTESTFSIGNLAIGTVHTIYVKVIEDLNNESVSSITGSIVIGTDRPIVFINGAKAIPYIYNGGWKIALPYVCHNNAWKSEYIQKYSNGSWS